MHAISVFDMFKIGVGPSSSHTMGPWRAAQLFLAALDTAVVSVDRVQVDLYGSLAKTGRGHGTAMAAQLGLMGLDAETIDVTQIPGIIAGVAEAGAIALGPLQHRIAFDPGRDLIFHFDESLPYHPNGIRFTAFRAGTVVRAETYFSVGGGFVMQEPGDEEAQPVSEPWALPFPIHSAEDLLRHCAQQQRSIAEVVRANELTWRSETQISARLGALMDVMFGSIHRGCTTEGTLPGGLKVQRRAARMAARLLGEPCPDTLPALRGKLAAESVAFQKVLSWVSCFALAVNEENASFGRIVTAPTNGAAGVIPAVLLYGLTFCDLDEEAGRTFLLVAGEIGSIFKKGATISAAMGGCQAEIGVSSAMAAAALCTCLGGTPAQACEAAEIAMEHHLGMTCDPIGGLVQIPCIERNAMGAVKAITAAQIALQHEVSVAKISLDTVIHTMWQTALDMNAKYKETSEGGLAVQLSVNLSEC